MLFYQSTERKFLKKYASVVRRVALRKNDKELMRKRLSEEIKSATVVAQYKKSIQQEEGKFFRGYIFRIFGAVVQIYYSYRDSK